MKYILITIASMSFFISCGPSAEQKTAIENEVLQRLKRQQDSIATVKSNDDAMRNAQKQHDDSIANSVAAKYQQKETLQNNQTTLNAMQNQYNDLQRLLVEDDAKLTALKDHKKSDEGFHIGRTQSQREQWLKNDQINIDNMSLQMLNIKKQMEDLKTRAQQYK